MDEHGGITVPFLRIYPSDYAEETQLIALNLSSLAAESEVVYVSADDWDRIKDGIAYLEQA